MRKLAHTAVVLAMTAGLLIAMVGTASAEGRAVRGEFHAFAAGASNPDYQDVTGHATLIRTADGKTIVSVHVAGLLPGTSYPSHVHAVACGAVNTDGSPAFAGGHYKFDTSLGTVASNEIWPGPFTTNSDGVGAGRTNVQHSARADAVSVVVHAPSGAKIACADFA